MKGRNLPRVPPCTDRSLLLPSGKECFNKADVEAILAGQARWQQLSQESTAAVLRNLGVPASADASKDVAALQQHILDHLPLQWSQCIRRSPVGRLLTACQSSASRQPAVTLFAVRPRPSTPAEAQPVAALYLYGGLQACAWKAQQRQEHFLLWEYKNPGWEECCCPFKAEVHGAAPAAVGYSTAVRESVSGAPQLWVFGGINRRGSAYLNTLHCCSLLGRRSSWHEVTQSGDIPAPRAFHQTAVDAGNDRMYLFGAQCCADGRGADIPGYDAASAACVYCFDFETTSWERLEAKGKAPDAGDVEAMHVVNNQLLVLSGGLGSKGVQQMTVHALNLEELTWQCLEAKDPPAGREGAAVAMYKASAWLVQGGKAQDGSLMSEAMLYSFDSNAWTPLGATRWGGAGVKVPTHEPQLPRTCRHSAAPYGDRVVVFSAADGALPSTAGEKHDASAGALVCVWRAVRPLPAPKGVALACSPPQMVYDVKMAQVVRFRIARCLRSAASKKLVFKASNSAQTVSCPAAVLFLYSSFFDEMFQDMLTEADTDAVPVNIGTHADLGSMQTLLQCIFGTHHTGYFSAVQLVGLFRLAHKYDMRFIAGECLASLRTAALAEADVAALLALTLDLDHCQELAGLKVRCVQWLHQQSKINTEGILRCLRVMHQVSCIEAIEASSVTWCPMAALWGCPPEAGGWPAVIKYALELQDQWQQQQQGNAVGGSQLAGVPSPAPQLLDHCMCMMGLSRFHYWPGDLLALTELLAPTTAAERQVFCALVTRQPPPVPDLLPLLGVSEAHDWPELEAAVMGHLADPDVNRRLVTSSEFSEFAQQRPNMAKDILSCTKSAGGKAAVLACSVSTMARCAKLLHGRSQGQQTVANLAVKQRATRPLAMKAWRSPKRKRNPEDDANGDDGVILDT